MSVDVTCPFCGRQGFDLIGLKNHLQGDCQEYNYTLSIEEERALLKFKQDQEGKP